MKLSVDQSATVFAALNMELEFATFCSDSILSGSATRVRELSVDVDFQGADGTPAVGTPAAGARRRVSADDVRQKGGPRALVRAMLVRHVNTIYRLIESLP